MITSLFKNNLLSYVLVSVIGIVVWVFAYSKMNLEVPATINFANQEYSFNKGLALLVSFFITLFGAALLNYKLKKYLFSYEPTNLFLLFYVLINSIGLLSEYMLTYSIISFLLVLTVNYLLYFIENDKNENQVFNAAFIIGLLVFQNISFVVLIPLLLLNLGAVKRVTIKEFSLILIGFLLPTIIVLLFTRLTENTAILDSLFQIEISFPKIPWKFGLFFLSLIFISIKGYRLVVTKRSGIDINIIRLTKNMFVYFMAIAIIIGLSLFLFPKEYVAFVFAIPLSIFLSDFFANSSFRYRELLFLIIISVPILIRILN